jgi:hypothetical protein
MPYKKVNDIGMTTEDFTSTNNIKLFYANEDTPTHLNYNGSNIKPNHNLTSTDIADVALRKIVDHPRCGHRVAVIVFRPNHKTPSKEPHYLGI